MVGSRFSQLVFDLVFFFLVSFELLLKLDLDEGMCQTSDNFFSCVNICLRRVIIIKFIERGGLVIYFYLQKLNP